MTIKGAVPRALVNIGILCLLFWFFQKIGWIVLAEETSIWLTVLCTVLVCMVLSVVLILIYLGTALLSAVNLTAGCIVLAILILFAPLLAYGELFLASKITGMFTITTHLWQGYLIGLAFGLLQFKGESKTDEKKDKLNLDNWGNTSVKKPYFPEAPALAVAMGLDEYCPFCSSRIFEGDRNCPECGGSLKK